MLMQGVIEDLALPARHWRLRLTLYSRTGNCPPAHSIQPTTPNPDLIRNFTAHDLG